MKTYMVQQREGKLLGPIDWNYNFRSHFDCYCTDDAGKQKECDAAVAQLRSLCNGKSWEATTDGGWPRVGWGRVLAVGMYDGWPYWRPVPSVLIDGFLGASWHSFDSVRGVKEVR